MSLPLHPLGVQPRGNALLGTGPPCSRAAGLGAFASLHDQLLLELLAEFAPAQLAQLSTASRALYAFCAAEDLWRAATLRSFGGDVRFRSSWRATWRRRLQGRGQTHEAEDEEQEAAAPRVDCSSVYSDLLFAPHLCASAPLLPRWLQRETVARVSVLGLSHADFVDRFEQPNVPVVLTDVVQHWQAWGVWSAAQLAAEHGSQRVFAGGYDFALSDYLAYAARVTRDDAPLYLFDREVLSRTALGSQFAPPAVVGGALDHFALLPAEQRPDHTWLIAGPPRSGSTWHKDPNSTSAWNGVVCGAKKWLLWPPASPPPGVAASPDGADVATTTSLVDWFLNFFEPAAADGRLLQCVCQAGDLLFVPSGWWHAALNVDDGLTIAVTSNFVSDANLHRVLAHLASPPERHLVSGCRSEEARQALHGRLVAALQRERPESLAAAEALVARPGQGVAVAAARINFAEATTFSFNFAEPPV